MRRDLLFQRIVTLSFGVVGIYAVGMLLVIVFAEDDALSLRMLNIFPGVLASVIALCTGYLIGHTNATHCDCPSCEVARYKVAKDIEMAEQIRKSEEDPD